jgi:3-methyladenine DNA glycosylase/8-oxoguanine DNA glycosylase
VVAVSSLGRGFDRNAGLLSSAFAMDELIESTGVSYRALRMPFFMENLLNQVDPIRTQGMFVMANSADRPLATVATRDIAPVAAALLLDDSWSGQDSVPVIGPDDLTPTDMAQVISEVLSRPVRVQQVPGEAYKATMMQYGMTDSWAQGLVDMAAAQNDGIYDAEQRAVQSTSGQSPAPTSFRQWCQEVLKPAVSASRVREIHEGFAHLHAADPVLAALIDKRPDYDADAWLNELPAMNLFGWLVFQIIGQQISVTAARAIFERLTRRFDERVPSAHDVAELDEQTLRDIGMSWRKARTVLDLAAHFADGRLSEKELSNLPDDRVVEELTKIPGIGPWTVHGALLIALRRADVVPTGDLMLRNTIKSHYDLDHVPTEDEVRDIAAPWHPHASLGVNLLFASAELD